MSDSVTTWTEATTKEKPKLSYPEKKEQMYQVSDFTLQIQDDKNSMVLAQPQTTIRIEILELNPGIFGQLLFDKGGKTSPFPKQCWKK